MKDHKEMGRFSVEFAVANYGEVVRLPRESAFWRISSIFSSPESLIAEPRGSCCRSTWSIDLDCHRMGKPTSATLTKGRKNA